MTIVAGVVIATAINADDVNQIPGNLHYAKVNLMGISCGAVVEKGLLAALPMRHLPRQSRPPGGRLGQNGRA